MERRQIWMWLVLPLLCTSQLLGQKVVDKRPRVPDNFAQISVCSPKHVWVKGHWKWSEAKSTYVWVQGRCVKAKKNHVYEAGFWARKNEGWIWMPGGWKKVKSSYLSKK